MPKRRFDGAAWRPNRASPKHSASWAICTTPAMGWQRILRWPTGGTRKRQNKGAPGPRQSSAVRTKPGRPARNDGSARTTPSRSWRATSISMQPAENTEHGKYSHQPNQLQHRPDHGPAPSLVVSRGKTADLRLDLPVPLLGNAPAVALHGSLSMTSRAVRVLVDADR